MPLTEVHEVTVSVYAFSVLNLVFPSHLLAVVHDFSCPSGNLLRLVSDVVERSCTRPCLMASGGSLVVLSRWAGACLLDLRLLSRHWMACAELELDGGCYYPVGQGLRLPSPPASGLARRR